MTEHEARATEILMDCPEGCLCRCHGDEEEPGPHLATCAWSNPHHGETNPEATLVAVARIERLGRLVGADRGAPRNPMTEAIAREIDREVLGPEFVKETPAELQARLLRALERGDAAYEAGQPCSPGTKCGGLYTCPRHKAALDMLTDDRTMLHGHTPPDGNAILAELTLPPQPFGFDRPSPCIEPFEPKVGNRIEWPGGGAVFVEPGTPGAISTDEAAKILEDRERFTAGLDALAQGLAVPARMLSGPEVTYPPPGLIQRVLPPEPIGVRMPTTREEAIPGVPMRCEAVKIASATEGARCMRNVHEDEAHDFRGAALEARPGFTFGTRGVGAWDPREQPGARVELTAEQVAEIRAACPATTNIVTKADVENAVSVGRPMAVRIGDGEWKPLPLYTGPVATPEPIAGPDVGALAGRAVAAARRRAASAEVDDLHRGDPIATECAIVADAAELRKRTPEEKAARKAAREAAAVLPTEEGPGLFRCGECGTLNRVGT